MTTNAEIRALMVVADALPRIAKSLESTCKYLEEIALSLSEK